MTTDEDSALSLVRKHLRQIDPPPGAKARASLQLEQRIRGRARTFRPVWALGLTGALVAGASMAAANRGGWFRSEPDRAPASQVAAPVARPTHAKEPRPRQDTPAVPVPPREEAEPASKPEQKRSAADGGQD